MTTVQDITTAITELPQEQLAELRSWLDEFFEAEWDTKIERDEREGKLDSLAERALAEFKAGRTTPK